MSSDNLLVLLAPALGCSSVLKRVRMLGAKTLSLGLRCDCVDNSLIRSFEGYVVDAVQVWNPDEWEAFSLALLQKRHGHLQVHKIPAAHKGDFGIDYYCTNPAVAYQCYAVQEPVDISTRADRQKKKITTDLGKLVKNSADISTLFLKTAIKNWVLLVPLHDSKDVNIHCANKTIECRGQNHPHLADDFEVGVNDQDSFGNHAVASTLASFGTVVLKVAEPTPAELSKWGVSSPDLLANVTRKLTKRTGAVGLDGAVADAIKLFLQGNAILDALRIGSPELHEKVMAAIANRARRLSFAGPDGGSVPGEILNSQIDKLAAAIKTSAPNLSETNSEEIALGVVSEWLMRCPLDFPPNAS